MIPTSLPFSIPYKKIPPSLHRKYTPVDARTARNQWVADLLSRSRIPDGGGPARSGAAAVLTTTWLHYKCVTWCMIVRLAVAVFGLESGLGLFPPGLDHKMYPLMDDHRPPPLDAPLFTSVKKKLWRRLARRQTASRLAQNEQRDTKADRWRRPAAAAGGGCVHGYGVASASLA
ncbi:hypothetical protein EVAR_94993_1 [Eumeta japonica]|uniref:Uncharacterized protein n=1 Tax=Eumeta variegata TaxID=151549 RepID=A0A4C1UUN3_EUMVA|nr:hypothetical protein EVAR_94993_1 [Eumeta japonica]